MKQTADIMGMPINVEIVGFDDAKAAIADVFAYFRSVDERYSTYKKDSEISRVNRGLPAAEWSAEMKTVLDLCEQTKQETGGYFDIKRPDDTRDPSGLVKGWAIQNAATLLQDRGARNFYLEAGGDIQVRGTNQNDQPWRIGIRNPLNRDEIIKTVALADSEAVATSGTYIRGDHIYNPLRPHTPPRTFLSFTVVGPDIYDADRFATAAFVMGELGLAFIEALPGFEAYAVSQDKNATFTSGFERYTNV
jgi:thiamine biosynthesis lipoprotein